MIIPLEIFRSAFILCIAFIILRFTDGLLFNLPFSSQYLVFPFYILWGYIALASITNLKRKAIRFYWKKEKKVLSMPFGNTKMLAYDECGNRYKLGLFFIPKRTH